MAHIWTQLITSLHIWQSTSITVEHGFSASLTKLNLINFHVLMMNTTQNCWCWLPCSPKNIVEVTSYLFGRWFLTVLRLTYFLIHSMYWWQPRPMLGKKRRVPVGFVSRTSNVPSLTKQSKYPASANKANKRAAAPYYCVRSCCDGTLAVLDTATGPRDISSSIQATVSIPMNLTL